MGHVPPPFAPIAHAVPVVGQAVHAEALGADVVPRAHTEHPAAPAREKRPASHGAQVAGAVPLPATGYEPAAHSATTHTDAPSSLSKPGAQLEHVVAPAALKDPALQRLQVVDDVAKDPAAHATVTGHAPVVGVHADDPGAEHEPGPH